MNWEKLYWEHIAMDIESTFEMGHPSDWNKNNMLNFLSIMKSEMIKVLEARPKLLIAYKCKGKDGTLRSIYYDPPSTATLRRLFILKDSTGKTKMKDQFAQLLGRLDHNDYMVYKKLHQTAQIHQMRTDSENEQEDTVESKIRITNIHQLAYIQSFNLQYELLKLYVKPVLIDEDDQPLSSTLSDLMHRGKRIVIHSDSFTGKTTFLKYIALNSPEHYTPIFLPLNEYKGDLLKLAMSRYDLDEVQATELLFRNPNTVLLLDAFDEIKEVQWRQYLLYDEIIESKIYRFILTSRSKFLGDIQLPASHVLKIESYKKQSIYLLVDKVSSSSAQVIEFHNLLRNTKATDIKASLLKYPWLIIFLMEHFRAQKELKNEFFLTLPIEIFKTLQRTLLLPARGWQQDEITQNCFEIGEWLFEQMLKEKRSIHEIPQDDISTEQIRFMNSLIHIGAANIFAFRGDGARGFHFTIPLIHYTFVAFYLSELLEDVLKAKLKTIYLRPEFKTILAYTLRMRVQNSQSYNFLLEAERYMPDGMNSQSSFEALFPYILLQYLPYGVFAQDRINRSLTIAKKLIGQKTINARAILQNYFKLVRHILKEDIANKNFEIAQNTRSYKDVFKYNTELALQNKLIDLLPFLLEKNQEETEKFWDFIEQQDFTDLHPSQKRKLWVAKASCVNTRAFLKVFWEKVETKDLYLSDYLLALAASPLQVPTLYKKLWNQILPIAEQAFFISQDEYSPREVLNKGRWEDQNELFTTAMLLLLKAKLKEEEFSMLLHLIAKHSTDLDDEDFFQANIGVFKSRRLSIHLSQFMLSKFKEGIPFSSFSSVFYLLSDHLLFDENNHQLISNLNEILDELIFTCQQLRDQAVQQTFEEMEMNQKSELFFISIHGFFYNFLSLNKIPGIQEKTEELFNSILQLQATGVFISKINFTLVAAYLCQLESQYFLNQIKENEYCLTYLIGTLADRLKDHHYWRNLEIANHYLQSLRQTYKKSCESMDIHPSYHYSVRHIIHEVIEIRSNSRFAEEEISPDYQTLLEDWLETKDVTILDKLYKYDAFESFLIQNSTGDMLLYAVLHAIYFVKPLFVRKGNKPRDLQFYFSA